MLRILIAVDGSELALDAVRHGLELVRRGGLQATLVLGHVQEEASLIELATQGADAVAQASVEAGQHLMAGAVALVEAARVPYETEIGLGPVAATLVDMGSVSQALVHQSPVPVTVVKHAEPQQAEDGEA
jgi:nucleotide-binding universal stress UspA family protein